MTANLSEYLAAALPEERFDTLVEAEAMSSQETAERPEKGRVFPT